MINIELGQILTQIVAFLIMLWILKRYAWKPLLNVMDERKKLIKSEFETIDQKKREADQLIDEYNRKLQGIDEEARHRIQEGVNAGRKLAQQIQEETQNQAKVLLNKAQGDMQREVQKAKEQLKSELVQMTISATTKILKGKLDVDTQQKVLSECVAEAEDKFGKQGG